MNGQQRIHFLMMGGFLGAGKTTTIARLAKHYTDQGKRVGLVTNDQAYDLVDTQSLRAQGFLVGEVPGACFCCKFDDLVSTMGELAESELPEIIIAEPVGSCTDLVATVIEPLRQLYGDRFDVGPLAVLLKPEHGSKILSDEPRSGFSPKAAYIFLKQLEEASLVVVNKVDKLSEDKRAELQSLVRNRFPNKESILVSSKTGENFSTLIEFLQRTDLAATEPLEIDYDVYAEGEAELGWFNCQVKARTQENLRQPLDDLVVLIVETLKTLLLERNVEPAHLKVMGQVETDFAIANLVASDEQVDLSLKSEISTDETELIVNARVADDPNLLEATVKEAAKRIAAVSQWRLELTGIQAFRPGRPTPTHRL